VHWEPPRQQEHATARATLTAAQRATLSQAGASLQLRDPALVEAGRTMADGLRSTLPGLDDEEIAAVLVIANAWLSYPASLTGCPHLSDAASLLGAITLDLAHLEIGT
jgi:hypothetical protein